MRTTYVGIEPSFVQDPARVSLEQLAGAPGELAVAVRDPAGGVRRPAQGDLPVGDGDVRVVVLRIRELGDAVHERDRLRERRQLEGPLERPVDLTPLVHRGQYRARRGKDPAPEDTNPDDERRPDRLVDGAARRGRGPRRRRGAASRPAAES